MQITITERTEAAVEAERWLLAANTSDDAIATVDKYGNVVWRGGVWRGGEWNDQRYDRLLYMSAMIGIVFDSDGWAVGYRSVDKNNRGRHTASFVQTAGRVDVGHSPLGMGTCCPGLHVTSAAVAWRYFGIDPTARLWKVRFRREDLLDCDGEKARIRGGECEEVPWPFVIEPNVTA